MIITALVFALAGMAVYTWRISEDNDRLRAEISKNFYDEMVNRYARYRTIYEFINVENAGDNATLNRKVKMLQDDGYSFDKQASQTGLLVFSKQEKVQEGEE